MNFKKWTMIGLTVGMIAGTTTNASAWWHRNKNLEVIDTSAMPKTGANWVNAEIYDTASQSTTGKLCRQVYTSTATYCSTGVTVSGSGYKSIQLGSKVSQGWNGYDFGYVSLSGGDARYRVIRGLFMSN